MEGLLKRNTCSTGSQPDTLPPKPGVSGIEWAKLEASQPCKTAPYFPGIEWVAGPPCTILTRALSASPLARAPIGDHHWG